MEQSRRRNDDYMCGNLASGTPWNEPFVQRTAETVMAERRLRYISMRNLTQQNYCYVLLFPFISFVFTEPLRTGAKNLVSETKIILPRAPGGGPSRKWLLTKLSKFRPKVCRVLPMVHYGANERGNTMKKLTIFQKIFNLQKLVPTQDLQENVSEGQHSITIPNVHVEGYGTTSSCREDTYP